MCAQGLPGSEDDGVHPGSLETKASLFTEDGARESPA